MIVVPAGMLTVEHWSLRIAAAKAGPSSPPELVNVHVPSRFEIDGKRLTVLVKSLPLEETAATMHAKRMASSSTQRTNLITIMVDNINATNVQEQV